MCKDSESVALQTEVLFYYYELTERKTFPQPFGILKQASVYLLLQVT